MNKLIIGLLLAVPSFARADVAQPRPGTWGVGVTGFDSTNLIGAPNFRYVAGDKTTLEFTPTVLWSGSRQALTINNTHNYALTLDVLRKLGTYRDTNLSWVAQAQLGYNYTSNFGIGSSYSKTRQEAFGLGVGFDVEHFFLPNFSVSARSLLSFTYGVQRIQTSLGAARGSSRSFGTTGQALSMHYYFIDDRAKVEAVPADRGRWAAGWQGWGVNSNAFTFSLYKPSIKYVIDDRWAVETVPSYSYSHNDTGNQITHSEALNVPVDLERTIARGRDLQLAWLFEPAFGYTVSHQKLPPFADIQTTTYLASLGTGLEIEYFLLPDLSVGARGLLVYSNAHASNYALTGYSGQTVGNSLFLTSQILSVRWYFGAPAN